MSDGKLPGSIYEALEAELRSVEQIAHAQRDEISALAEHGDAMAAAHAALRKAHRAALQQNDLLEARIERLRAQVDQFRRQMGPQQGI